MVKSGYLSLLSLLAPSVSHTFSSSQSVYYVTVVAFNDHGRKEATQKVCLQERLQGQYNNYNNYNNNNNHNNYNINNVQ